MTDADRLVAAEAACDALQQQLDQLHGAQFSDRVYHALKSRAETAEAEVARLRAACQQLVEQWRGPAATEAITRGYEETGVRLQSCANELEAAVLAGEETPQQLEKKEDVTRVDSQ